jgi:dethiobiotin synthetase
MSARGYFIAGTDTGVGKTLVACALLERARALGLRAVGMKPIAAGCHATLAGLRNDDALALLAHSSDAGSIAYDDLNPYALADAVSPHLAAQHAGVVINPQRIVDAHARLAASADLMIIEGAGGWLTPIANTATMADLARRLALPVILVVGLRLGCLNHAQLSARAIVADGCTLAGWVGSVIDPDMAGLEGNIATLRQLLPAPSLGLMPWISGAAPNSFSQHVRLPIGESV